MKYWALLVWFLAILCTSCTTRPNPPPGLDIVKTIQRRNDKNLQKKGLYSTKTGGAGLQKIVIDGMYVTNQYRFTSIDEARAFFCNFFDDYMKPFNEDPSLQPYLPNFPLTEKNFWLSITFLDENHNQLQKPYIEEIRNFGDRIAYSTYDPTKGPAVRDSNPILHVETFEEARALLKQGNKKPPVNP